jgi:hypothetical protein
MRREKSACSREMIPKLKMSRIFNHAISKRQQQPWNPVPGSRPLPGCLLLFGQFPEVSH